MTSADRGSTTAEPDRVNTRVLDAYEHILLAEDWDLESLRDALGLAREAVPAVLDALIAARLLRPSQEHPGDFTAVAPAVGLREIVATRERDLLARSSALHDLMARSLDIEQRFADRVTERRRATFEELHGQDATLRRIGEIITTATASISTVVSSRPTAETLEQARHRDHELAERGIRLRAIYLEGHRRQSRALREYLAWLTALGAHVRTRTTLPTRLLCVDSHVAVVAIKPSAPAAGAIVIHTPGLVATVNQFFDLLWAGAKPLGSGTGADRPGGLDDVELAVIRLLAAGHKDESVARRVGISLRSVRRMIGGLNEKLGASSRFELGVRCRDLGLAAPSGVQSGADPRDGGESAAAGWGQLGDRLSPG